MSDCISRAALLAAYDAAHVGPPGGARKLMEAAPAVPMPEWISVKDRRPEYNARVLFVDEQGKVWLAKGCVDWPDGGVSFLDPESGLWVRGTHWMKLPDPPKGGDGK